MHIFGLGQGKDDIKREKSKHRGKTPILFYSILIEKNIKPNTYMDQLPIQNIIVISSCFSYIYFQLNKLNKQIK